MIASGLPQRNGDQHAVEIALSALHIVHCVSSYRFPYVSEGLKIRIGCHTGIIQINCFFSVVYRKSTLMSYNF